MEASPAIKDLSNKIALITGASSGLGRAIAISLVASADLNPTQPTPPILTETMKPPDIDIMGIVANSGAASYCASKGAVLQMTKAVALDYARDGIHVNSVAPWWMETAMLEPLMAREEGVIQGKAIGEMHPWRRMAKPGEVAAMVVFLAGPEASFSTG